MLIRLLLEDGSGVLELESGNGALLLEESVGGAVVGPSDNNTPLRYADHPSSPAFFRKNTDEADDDETILEIIKEMAYRMRR